MHTDLGRKTDSSAPARGYSTTGLDHQRIMARFNLPCFGEEPLAHIKYGKFPVTVIFGDKFSVTVHLILEWTVT